MGVSYGLQTHRHEAALQILLSVLAFFLGFVALWCVASFQTRIQRHVEDDANTRAVAVESTFGELANRIRSLEKRLAKAESTVSRLREARAEDSLTLAILERRARQHDEDRSAGHDHVASTERNVA
jgi:cytoskeletal protein RodZ